MHVWLEYRLSVFILLSFCCLFESDIIGNSTQPLNPQIGFNVYSIQGQIQPLNPEIGFNINSMSIPLKDKFNPFNSLTYGVNY